MYKKIIIYSFFVFIFMNTNNAYSTEDIPNIVGTWIGENKTVSEPVSYTHLTLPTKRIV